MSVNDFLGKLPDHQATVATGLILAYGTGMALAIAGIAGREVNAGVLTIWLGFVAAVLGVGGVSGYGKRTTDLDYQLAKKGIVPPTLTAPPVKEEVKQ